MHTKTIIDGQVGCKRNVYLYGQVCCEMHWYYITIAVHGVDGLNTHSIYSYSMPVDLTVNCVPKMELSQQHAL